MSADCRTCRLMDDGLPCEYHRGLADGAAERAALAAKVARVEALADELLFEQGDLGSDTITIRRAAETFRAALKDQP